MHTPHKSPLVLVLALAIAALAISTRPTQAKTRGEASYAFERVWPTLLRFLRVDERHKIVEKDAEAGYVLFEVADENKTFPASIELIRIKDRQKRDAVRFNVRIDDRPLYMELGLIERLAQKLRKELGSPPAPPRREKKPDKQPVKPSDLLTSPLP